MIVALIGIDKFLVGQVGNRRGITAGVIAVGRIREQQRLHCLLNDAVHAGHGALHLIENDAVIRKMFSVIFVMPTFLPEDIGVRQDLRREDRVQIDGSQVQIVLRIAAGNRVQGLIRERHRVQERAHGALQQLDKGLLDGVFLGTAKHGML